MKKTRQYPNGDIYNGSLKNGIRSGEGKMTYANGEVYDGFWENDMRNHEGIMTYANGDTYDGIWENDMRNHEGKMTYANGEVYDGIWRNDMRSGKGKMTYATGEVYDGIWRNDMRSGNGKMTYATGEVYDGFWENNVRNHEGILTYATGEVYDGIWENDIRNGVGTMTYANGEVYDGNWRNDMRNGVGTMTYTTGEVYNGIWRNEVKILGKIYSPGASHTIPTALGDKIQISDISNPFDTISASAFLHENESAFIIVNNFGTHNKYIGHRMKNINKKMYLECKDDTPSEYIGSNDLYKHFIKEGTENVLYMKLPLNDGMVVMVQLPLIISGTCFFKLVEQRSIFKFMDFALSNGVFQDSAMGSDHCNQTSPQKVYRLEEVSIEKLVEFASTDLPPEKKEEEKEEPSTIKIQYKDARYSIHYPTDPQHTTIHWLKDQFSRLLNATLNIVPTNIRLVYNGRILRDDSVLSDLVNYKNAILVAMITVASGLKKNTKRKTSFKTKSKNKSKTKSKTKSKNKLK